MAKDSPDTCHHCKHELPLGTCRRCKTRPWHSWPADRQKTADSSIMAKLHYFLAAPILINARVIVKPSPLQPHQQGPRMLGSILQTCTAYQLLVHEASRRYVPVVCSAVHLSSANYTMLALCMVSAGGHCFGPLARRPAAPSSASSQNSWSRGLQRHPESWLFETRMGGSREP